MRNKLLSLFAALLLVTGCSSTGSGDANGMGGAGQAGQVVPGTQADLVQNVGDRVFFAFDSSSLTPEARAILDRQAEWLGKYSSVKLAVVGTPAQPAQPVSPAQPMRPALPAQPPAARPVQRAPTPQGAAPVREVRVPQHPQRQDNDRGAGERRQQPTAPRNQMQ